MAYTLTFKRSFAHIMARSLKVAVIGAGVAGLVTGRELKREGHRVVIYEKANQLGGMWLYNPRVDSDPLSLDPNRQLVHSSLYSSLRTNFPRHLMGFSDYQFIPRENGDSRIFPRHEEVLKFLNDFSRHFELRELIRFNTDVLRVERVDSRNDEWLIKSRTNGLRSEEVFEAVVVCNGHYTEPQVANLPGIQKWPRKQVHSHNYRIPEPFRDQIVVTIGDGPSAHDISRDIARVAKEVHLSSRSPYVNFSKLDSHTNLWQHSKINHVNESGLVTFVDGSSIHADIIFYCTGYKYSFPFLETNGIVTIEDNRVGPLYKHVFPPQLGPSLCFVGIPYRGIMFRAMELQGKWVSQALSGKVTLPSQEKMLKDTKQHYQHMEEFGIPKHHTHRLHPYEFEYLDWLAAQVGVPPSEKRLKQIYEQLFKIIACPKLENFREWDVDQWIQTSL